MSSFLAGPIDVAYHVVYWLAHVLAPLPGGLATAAAIVAFTVGVRLLLSPLSFLGMRGQARIAAVAPRAQELRARYARQPERLQAELGSLYQQEAGGMLAGCLPLLLQLPFFSVMYRLFLSGSVGGKPNGLLSAHLLGAPLGGHWLSGAGPLSAQGLVFLGLFALLALAGAVSARLAQAAAAPLTPGTRGPAGPAGRGAAAPGAGAPRAAAPGAGAIGAITKILPFTTVIIAAFVPLAAGLYLLTTTAWTLAERTLLRRRIAPVATGAVAMPPAGSAR
jgi:YidC/Oxa1 family membrane protein insertase